MVRARVSTIWLAGALAGCAAAKPGEPPPSGDRPALEHGAGTATSAAPTEGAAVVVGVATIASLPRPLWPCATVHRDSLRQTIEYGELDACWFPPDRWEPGCPLAIGDRAWQYDERGRLAAYFERAVEVAGPFAYVERQVVSADTCISYRTEGTRVRLDFGTGCEDVEGTPQARLVELDAQQRPSLIVDLLGGERASTTELVFDGPRLLSRTLRFYDGDAADPLLVLPWRYEYACEEAAAE